ncbi:MAG: substrate-binding domain-containing protein [Casimicrobiaceae bacterium]
MNRLAAIVACVVAYSLAASASAAEVRVLSAGAVEPGLRAFAQLVTSVTGDVLVIQYNTAPRIAERLAAGETFDILVSPPAVVAQAVKDGKAVASSGVPVGRVGAGIVVRKDAPVPDVATVDALKKALLAADGIVYNNASTGLYLDRLFEKMGILGQLQPKTTRYADGAAVMEHLLKGKGNEIGFGAITEILQYDARGLRLAGPLPAAVQNYTSYDAALMSAASASTPAKAALALLATPAGKAAFVAAGVE